MIKTLEELSLIKGEYGGGFSAVDYSEDKPRYIRITDIKEGGELKKDTKSPSGTEKDWKKYKLVEGDILFARSGATVGKTFLYEEKYGDCIYAGYLIRFKPNTKIAYPKYVYYYTRTPKYNAWVLNKQNVVAQPNINAKQYGTELKIPLPPLPTQKKIAALLDAADLYRQKTKALIEKYDELTQSLFLDMFGDPVVNEKGWENYKFIDVLEIRNGKNQKAIENEAGKYPIYGSGGIMGYGDDFISEANSVIIGRKGNINKPILVKEKYWHVDTAFGLNPNKTLLMHDYLFWFCNRYNFEQHNRTVTIPSLTKETLLRISIPVPPIDLQNQFSERVQKIEVQKAQVQESLDKAEELFNSLLGRAFKGELN